MAIEKLEKNFTVRLTESEFEYLKEAGLKEGYRAGAFLRELLKRYKNEQEKKEQAQDKKG